MSFLFNCCKRDNTSKGGQYQIERREGDKYKTQYVNNVKDIKDWNQTERVLRVNRSQYDELMSKYTGDKKWTDPTFPPGTKSLGKLNSIPFDCEWKRISQIIDRPQLFVGRIQPEDVVQGSLGDCYFLSAVSALAQKQGTITKVFGNQQYNPNGIYKVTLRIDGIIQQVLVDDFVPVNKSNKPIFCQPRNNEFWVLILEKAWAKANGSYANINNGKPSDVFKAVTYAPSELKPIKNQSQYLDKLWQQILFQSKINNPVCCGTSRDQNIKWNDLGLVASHAYTLVDAANVRDEQGKIYRMLKIRNPWGYNEWRGLGNEADHAFWARIPQSEKASFANSLEFKNDGLFYMLYEDFCHYFNEVHFCYMLEKAIYEVEPMYADGKHGSIFTLNVKQQNDYIIELHQSSIKGEDDLRLKQGINRSTLLLARGNNYEFLDGSLKYYEIDNSLKAHLTPGQYYIYAKIDPSLNQKLMPQSLSVSSYSNDYADIQPTEQSAHPEFFKKVFLSYARNNRRKQFNNGLMWISWKLLFEKGGYAYLAFGVDPRSEKKFIITVDEAQFNNLGYILKKPHKGKGRQVLQIRPGQQQIIVARVKNGPLQPMKFPPQMDIQVL